VSAEKKILENDYDFSEQNEEEDERGTAFLSPSFIFMEHPVFTGAEDARK
jgi:hypothetical protein